MAKAKIHIWHNVGGEILAIGRPVNSRNCVPIPGQDQATLETEIEEALIPTLHSTHIVDVHQKRLVKRTPVGKPKRSAK